MEDVSYLRALKKYTEDFPSLRKFLDRLDEKKRAVLEKRKIRPCCPGDLEPAEKVFPLVLSFSALQEAGLNSNSVLSDILFAAIRRNNTAAKHRAAYAVLLAHSEGRLHELEGSLRHLRPSRSSVDLHSRQAIIKAQELVLGKTGTFQYPSLGILEEARAIHPEDAQALRRGEIVKKPSQLLPVLSFSCCSYEARVADTLNSILSAYERVFSCRSPTYVPPTFPLPLTKEKLVLTTAGFVREHTSHVMYNPEVGLLVVYKNGKPVSRLALLLHDNTVHVTSPPLGLPRNVLTVMMNTLEKKLKGTGLVLRVPWLKGYLLPDEKRIHKRRNVDKKYEDYVSLVFEDDYKSVLFVE